MNWALAREFVWGERFPELVALIDYTDAGQQAAGTAEPFYYLLDALGSVVALVGEGGEVVERYTYEPYGTTLISNADGSAIRAVSAYGNPFGFTGQRYDAAVGLYHFRHRSYSPRMGRWLQPDPAGYPDGVNLFEYVRSNPIMGFDPWGLEATDDDVEALIGGYGGGTVAQKRAHYADTGIPNLPSYDAYRQGLDTATEYGKLAAEIGLPIGNALDLYAALTGKDLLTGQQLSVGGRVVAGLDAALGSKRVTKALGFLSSTVKRAGNMSRKKCGVAPAKRLENLQKGIPESHLGPSGKPKIHVVEHSTQKRAKDAARAEVGKGGTTVKHASPQEGGPHYHGQSSSGEKSRVHHEYPE